MSFSVTLAADSITKGMSSVCEHGMRFAYTHGHKFTVALALATDLVNPQSQHTSGVRLHRDNGQIRYLKLNKMFRCVEL